jgi:hypothetical protein
VIFGLLALCFWLAGALAAASEAAEFGTAAVIVAVLDIQIRPLLLGASAESSAPGL